MSRQVYGHSFERYGKQVRVIPILEGHHDKRTHYHLALDCPRDELVESFPSLIHSNWIKTLWGYQHVHVQPCNNGWIGYMSKLQDKADFGSSIDWMNFHDPK